MVQSVVTPLIEKTRIELRYVRGMRCMHAERYLVYCDELKAARQRYDWAERRRLIASLSAFSGEMQYLVHKHQSVCDRLFRLKAGQGFADEPLIEAGADAPEEASSDAGEVIVPIRRMPPAR